MRKIIVLWLMLVIVGMRATVAENGEWRSGYDENGYAFIQEDHQCIYVDELSFYEYGFDLRDNEHGGKDLWAYAYKHMFNEDHTYKRSWGFENNYGSYRLKATSHPFDLTIDTLMDGLESPEVYKDTFTWHYGNWYKEWRSEHPLGKKEEKRSLEEESTIAINRTYHYNDNEYIDYGMLYRYDYNINQYVRVYYTYAHMFQNGKYQRSLCREEYGYSLFPDIKEWDRDETSQCIERKLEQFLIDLSNYTGGEFKPEYTDGYYGSTSWKYEKWYQEWLNTLHWRLIN